MFQAQVARSPVGFGIACMIVGNLLLTSQDAVTKWLTSDLTVGEIVFYRSVICVGLLLILMRVEKRPYRELWPNRPGLNLWRAVIALICTCLVVFSYVNMPLADALAIIFVSPLILTALSVPVLGETVGWRRWAAVIVGFCGVLLITKPGAEGFQWWVVIPLGAAFAGALRDLATRQIGSADSATTVLFWTMIVSTLGSATTFFFGAHLPTPSQWLLLLAAAVMATASHWLTIFALQLVSASILSPMKYLALVWAAVIGYAVWGDVPDVWKVAGAVIVCGSGLYVWRRETTLMKLERLKES